MLSADYPVMGFHTYEALTPVGFTPRVIQELEQLIIKFTHSSKVHLLLKFYQDLKDHIYRSPNAHQLNIEEWKEELLQQLYYLYRQAGFNGSQQEMLLNVIKNIEIATAEDLLRPVSKYKAVGTDFWRSLAEQHSNDPNAHPYLYKFFHNNYEVFNRQPVIYLDYTYPENLSYYENDFNLDDTWDPNGGTFLFGISYNSPSVITQTLYSIQFNNKVFRIDYAFDDSGYSKLMCFMRDEISDNLMYDKILEYAQSGVTGLVLAYNRASVMFLCEDDFDVVVTQFPVEKPLSTSIHVPIAARGLAIRKFAYYTTQASAEEAKFLLQGV